MSTPVARRPARPMLLVGLTGGIGTGKSEVDRTLAELGAHVIDADEIVHRLLATDAETVREVAAVFSSGVLAPEGGVDRKALGRIVFHDAEARDVLNKILHPKTKVVLLQEIEEIRRNGSAPIVVVDAALLVESGFHREFDRLVVVSSSTENQLQRLVQRDALTREEALARIAAQWPTEAKLAIADYRLSNDGNLEELRSRVRRVYSALLEDLKRKTQEQAR